MRARRGGWSTSVQLSPLFCLPQPTLTWPYLRIGFGWWSRTSSPAKKPLRSPSSPPPLPRPLPPTKPPSSPPVGNSAKKQQQPLKQQRSLPARNKSASSVSLLPKPLNPPTSPRRRTPFPTSISPSASPSLSPPSPTSLPPRRLCKTFCSPSTAKWTPLSFAKGRRRRKRAGRTRSSRRRRWSCLKRAIWEGAGRCGKTVGVGGEGGRG